MLFQIAPNAKPRGRWAQKGSFEPDALELRTSSDSPNSCYAMNTIQINNNSNNQTSDYNSASSKDVYNNTYLSEDSSIDSGMENRRDVFLSKSVNYFSALHFYENILKLHFILRRLRKWLEIYILNQIRNTMEMLKTFRMVNEQVRIME